MWPAIIAAGVAGTQMLSNYLSGEADRKSREQGRKDLQSQRLAAEADYDRILSDIDTYYNSRGSLGTADDVEAYKKAMYGYNPDDFSYTPEKTFDQSYTKSRDDFLNPYYDQIIGDAAAQVQHTAAGAGIGRGSGAAQAIAKSVAEKENELFKEAQQEYKDDRNFEYQKYTDAIEAAQKALDTKRAATETKLSYMGDLAQDYYGVMDARQSDRLKAMQDRIATGATYSTAMQGLY